VLSTDERSEESAFVAVPVCVVLRVPLAASVVDVRHGDAVDSTVVDGVRESREFVPVCESMV